VNPAQGWYRDPERPEVERWWTGTAWDQTTSRRAGAFSANFRKPIDALPLERVTTLHELPGYRIATVVGVVTELSATSGFTATSKGNVALDQAMANLRRTASERGANAVVGLSASTFGARGGVTGALGGDAVGVLLVGTAVLCRAG
jgi:uncharacterized protein YbjQ (UPF0145 family)